MSAPAPQQFGNVGASPFYSMGAMWTNPFISMMRGIPIIGMLPAALQTGMQLFENVADRIDHTLPGLAGGQFVSAQPFPKNTQSSSQNSMIPSNFANSGAQIGQPQQNQNGNNPLNIPSNKAAQSSNPLSLPAFAPLSNELHPNTQLPIAVTNEADKTISTTDHVHKSKKSHVPKK